MATAGMALVSLVIYALLETLIDLFLKGAVWISQQIMNESITVFGENDNMLDSFYSLLPVGFSETDNKEAIIDIAGIIDGITVALLVLIIIASVLKSISAPITGEDAENPIQVIIRAIIALFLKVAIFGSSLFAFDGLLGLIGKIFTIAMSYVGEKLISLEDISFADGTLTVNPVAYIGMLLLTGALVAAVIGAAITYIERILTFIASLILGPIAVILYANKSTSDVTKSWIESIFAQLGAILLSLIMWALFLAQVSAATKSDSGFIEWDAGASVRIFQLGVAIAILSLVRNSEKIFNNLGIRTMPNSESARAVLGGIGIVASSLGLAARGGAISQRLAGGFLHRSDKSGPIRGGGGGRYSFQDATTGNSSIYNKAGDMSVKGTGLDKAGKMMERSIARTFQGGTKGPALNTPISGPIHAMQKGQALATEHMANAVRDGKVGSGISGMSMQTGVTAKSKADYTSSQVANMAISGKADGNGRFSFVPQKGGKTPPVSIAQTTSEAGNVVKGFVGSAVYSHNGVDTSKGNYFVPTQNGHEALPIGQSIDMGDGIQRQITGTKVAISADAYAYEVKPVSTLDAQIREHLDASKTELDIDIPIKETPIFEQVMGESNIEDGESYDPN